MRHLVPSLAVLAACAVSPMTVPVSIAEAQTAPPAPLPDVSTVVENVQKFYNQTNTFQSDFEQTFLVKAYNQTKTSHGHVIFSKPGKMNWDYSSPAGNRVVSDGVTLHVYEQANNQVYEQPVAQTQYPGALSFLTGQGQLSSFFNFTLRDGAGQLGFPGGWVLIGTPITPTAAYQKVLFYVDRETSQIRSVLILDGQSNRNRFDFVGVPEVNMPVNPNAFVFVPPPGVTVIRP